MKTRVTILLLAALLVALTGAQRSFAQDATATPAASGTGLANQVDALFVACADGAVMNLSGTLLIGWDIYYQVFSGSGGTGTPLTNLRQVEVGGEFTFSERVAFLSGNTLAAGAAASVKVMVARDNDSSRVDFDFVANDTQDGCSEPQYGAGTSLEGGSGATSGAGTARVSSIFAPNGAVLNPNLALEPEVVVGARPSDTFRSATPGLIFAECDAYDVALPGLVYDTDTITVYWSWFTKTQAQMDEHLASANYAVRLNTALIPDVTRSEVTRRGANYWVFYTATVGNLRPGHYEVEYNLQWNQPVNDGYDDYGPGTPNPLEASTCNFDVTPNPDNIRVVHSGLFFPTTSPVHNLFPNE